MLLTLRFAASASVVDDDTVQVQGDLTDTIEEILIKDLKVGAASCSLC